ncbi:tyrosine-type recombinase/integrase, partial [Solemya elarraichensis gill symbiont]
MASIRKKPNGKYEVQVRSSGLRPVSRTFSKMKDAKAFIREIEGDSELARKLGAPVRQTLTFQQLKDLYMVQYTGRDPSTDGRLVFWCDQFGNKQVTDIDALDVDDGLLRLARKNYTGSTINRYKSTLSAVFIFFIQHPDHKRMVQHLKFTNPVRQETVSRFRENPSKDRFLSENEQKSLLEACEASHWDRLYLLVLMALTTGARKGELLNLKWSDIDFHARTAMLGTTKNGKPRLLPLTRP